jgi:putative peptidoglycan lipid II flippase
VVLFYPWWGVSGLAWGVVLGSGLHLLAQLPAVLKKGWCYRSIWERTAEFRKMIRLMLPRTIGLAANQVNQLVITSIASTLSIGSIAVFNLANNLQNFPISILVVFGSGSFPVMSRLGRLIIKRIFGEFFFTFRKVLFFMIPVSVFILILRAQIVRWYWGGAFDWRYLIHGAVWGFFHYLYLRRNDSLLARSFYFRERYGNPVVVGVISVIINLCLVSILAISGGVIGLAMAFSIAYIINMCCY